MKTIRGELYQGKRNIGFTTNFCTYGKNRKDNYRLELSLIDGFAIPLYQGKKKPVFRNLYILSALWFPIWLSINILTYTIGIFLYQYITGATNFFKNSAWIDGVRFFNWVNFIAVIGLIILLILK